MISDRNKCISCHQSETPIFSRFPWRESVGHDSQKFKEIALSRNKEFQEEMKNNKFLEDHQRASFSQTREGSVIKGILDANKDRQEVEGINLSLYKPDPLIFDFQTKAASQKLRNYNLCSNLCNSQDKKEEELCQRLFTYSQIAYTNERVRKTTPCKEFQEGTDFCSQHDTDKAKRFGHLPYEDEEILIGTIRKNLDKTNGFGFPSPIIVDRDPISEEFFGAAKLTSPTELDQEATYNFSFNLESPKGPDSQLLAPSISEKQDFVELKTSAKAGDPLEARPISFSLNHSDLTNNELLTHITSNFNTFGSCINSSLQSSTENREKIAKVPLRKLWTKINESLDKRKETYPYNYDLIISDILNINNNTQDLATPCLKVELLEPPESITKLEQDLEGINPFQKYCMQCHSVGPLSLPLNNIDEMANYTGVSGKTVIGRLERREMPPKLPGLPRPTESEYTEIIKYLKTLKIKK